MGTHDFFPSRSGHLPKNLHTNIDLPLHTTAWPHAQITTETEWDRDTCCTYLLHIPAAHTCCTYLLHTMQQNSMQSTAQGNTLLTNPSGKHNGVYTWLQYGLMWFFRAWTVVRNKPIRIRTDSSRTQRGQRDTEDTWRRTSSCRDAATKTAKWARCAKQLASWWSWATKLVWTAVG